MNVSPSPLLPKKFSSLVQKHFDKTEEKACCKLCEKILICRRSNTSPLIRHLESHHPTVWKKTKEVEPLSIKDLLMNPKVKPMKYKLNSAKRTKLNTLLARMVAKDLIPLNVVKGEGFRGKFSSIKMLPLSLICIQIESKHCMVAYVYSKQFFQNKMLP